MGELREHSLARNVLRETRTRSSRTVRIHLEVDPSMRVRVLFFGMLKEMVGKSADTIDLPEGASVADILKQ